MREPEIFLCLKPVSPIVAMLSTCIFPYVVGSNLKHVLNYVCNIIV